MKKVTFFNLVILFAALHASAQYEISGTITYANVLSTPMNNCTVYLLSGTDTLAQTLTSASGFYSFSNLNTGVYQLVITTTKPNGGGASSDAIGILRHFLGIPPVLTGLKLRAADTNGDGFVTPADALHVSRRFVNQIVSYYPPYVSEPGAPDWLFDPSFVTLTYSSVTANIKAICTGDTNGSYIPVP